MAEKQVCVDTRAVSAQHQEKKEQENLGRKSLHTVETSLLPFSPQPSNTQTLLLPLLPSADIDVITSA